MTISADLSALSRAELEHLCQKQAQELASERERSQEIAYRLEASELLFQTIFERAAIGIIRAGVETHMGEFFEVNQAACQFIGYNRDELAQMHIPEFSHPDDLEKDIQALQGLLAGDYDFYKLEKRFIHRSGEMLWGNLTVSLVRDKAGAPLFTISTIEDITQRKHMELKLREMNEKLEQRVRQRTAKLRELSNQLVQIQENERQRVSRDLHDSVIQILSAAKFQLELHKVKLENTLSEQTEQIDYILKLFTRAIQEARIICHHLRPSELDDLGLLAALRSLCEDSFGRSDLSYRIEDVKIPHQLSAEAEISIYRVLQEIFSNIDKHARATEVELFSEISPQSFQLHVRDNGVGFDTELAVEPTRESGWGLMNMKERLENLAGQLDLISAPDQGTEIVLKLPLEQA